MGERSNFILVPMFHAAIRQLLDWGIENVQAYCQQLVTGPINTLRMLGCEIEEDGWRGSHLFGIRLPKRIDISDVKKRLVEEKVIVSYRGDAIRVSPNIYNTQKELWKLVSVFEEVFRDDE
jgi:selenocysteine lyase/cysteine desulfurase